MKKYLSIVTFLILVGNIAFAQSYTFKVLANKGDNKVKSGADWKSLKTGAALNAADELEMSDNAYLGLVHSSGKTLELKSAGNHKVKDLAAKVNSGGSSVASRYADFVLSKMSAENKANRLSATGAVTREIDQVGNEPIAVYMPNSVDIFNEKAIVRWGVPEEDDKTYVVTVKNMFDDVLLSLETKDDNFELDMSDDKISKENVILFDVTEKGNESKRRSDTYAMKKLGNDDSDKVKEILGELMSEVTEETALNKYILAGFYEENNLIADALTSYEQAIKLAPDVASYQEAYEEFLYRNGLVKE